MPTSSHSYEALKKAIPSPPSPTPAKPSRPTYTDLESAPLLPESTEAELAESQKPFFDLLAKELRKVAKFYETEEGRLIDEGQALEREIEEEETREERERERETARWAAEDGENDHDGLDYVQEEGESQVGSLGVNLGGPAAGSQRGRLGRTRSSMSAHGRREYLVRPCARTGWIDISIFTRMLTNILSLMILFSVPSVKRVCVADQGHVRPV